MKKINCTRKLIGGVVAGIVMFFLQGVIHMGLLQSDWQEWHSKTASVLNPMPESTAMILWFLQSLVLGMAGVWMYAAIRPRFGAGPKTAVFAGLTLWVVYWVGSAFDHAALGSVPERVCMISTGGGIIVAVVSVLAGAWLYKE